MPNVFRFARVNVQTGNVLHPTNVIATMATCIIQRKACAFRIAVSHVWMVNVLRQINVNVIKAISLPTDHKVFVSQFVKCHAKMPNALSRMFAPARMDLWWPMITNRTSAIAVCIALRSTAIAIVWTKSIAFRVIAFGITFHRFVRRAIVSMAFVWHPTSVNVSMGRCLTRDQFFF